MTTNDTPIPTYTELLEDRQRLDWLESSGCSVGFALVDNPDGKSTRHLWVVEGCDASKYRHGIREAIDAAMDNDNSLTQCYSHGKSRKD